MIIPQCYDSHLHLLASGQVQSELNLKNLRSFSELRKMLIPESAFRSGWLFGFGWDQNRMELSQMPNALMLDEVFSDFPVYFSRADGHVALLNTRAMQELGVDQSQGIFIDNDKVKIDRWIPKISLQNSEVFLINAIRYLNKNGFTHARDMSCTQSQWQTLKKLDEENLLTLYVEENFTCDSLLDFERCFSEIKYAQQNPSAHLRVGGVKVYLDGALGSQGALVSHAYENQQFGLLLMAPDEFESILRLTWRQDLPLCVHTIGDQAIEIAAAVALKVQSAGLHGQIHFEHGQIIQPKTIEKLKKLDCVVHMQPCHYLSDRLWLKNKIGPLFEHVFPWAALTKASVRIQFGSDTPIEPASVQANLQALLEAAKDGIAPIEIQTKYFSHPDPRWGAECFTDFSESSSIKVQMDGKLLS
jgi:predicted amidohydrolase YtcJ